ncbi:hypothetical protein H4R35_001702 [Dimargaris xerosporica]|nr:hypothetical protein H4R35_001702 [Dimargaris xerosporica]
MQLSTKALVAWLTFVGGCPVVLGKEAVCLDDSLHRESTDSSNGTRCYGEGEKALADLTHYQTHLAQSTFDIKLILKLLVHQALDSIDCKILKGLMEQFGLPGVSPAICREFLTVFGKILDELVFNTVTLTSLDAVGQVTANGQHQFMATTMDSVMDRFGHKHVEAIATQLQLPTMSEQAKENSVKEIRRVVHEAMIEFDANHNAALQ